MIRGSPIGFKVYSLTKGYWTLWAMWLVQVRSCHMRSTLAGESCLNTEYWDVEARFSFGLLEPDADIHVSAAKLKHVSNTTKAKSFFLGMWAPGISKCSL